VLPASLAVPSSDGAVGNGAAAAGTNFADGVGAALAVAAGAPLAVVSGQFGFPVYGQRLCHTL